MPVSLSAALRSHPRRSVSTWVDGGKRGATGHPWVQVLGATQPAFGSPRAEPHNQPLAPLTHLSAPLGERIWRGEKEGEKQAGCEGTRPTPV